MQNYQENPPKEATPPMDNASDDKDTHKTPVTTQQSQQPEAMRKDQIDFIMDKLNLLDKFDETAVSCSKLYNLTANINDRIT